VLPLQALHFRFPRAHNDISAFGSTKFRSCTKDRRSVDPPSAFLSTSFRVFRLRKHPAFFLFRPTINPTRCPWVFPAQTATPARPHSLREVRAPVICVHLCLHPLICNPLPGPTMFLFGPAFESRATTSRTPLAWISRSKQNHPLR